LGGALIVAGYAAAAGESPPVAATEAEAVEKAIDRAVSRIAGRLTEGAFPGMRSIVVLPVIGEDHGEYATTALEAAVTKSPYGLFTRDNAEVNRLLEEIEWGTKRGDVMDEATIQKFGKVKGVDAVMWGKVLSCGLELGGVRARTKVSAEVVDVETFKKWTIGPVEGKAYNLAALTQFWRYPAFAACALVGLVVVMAVLRMIVKAVKHAARPL